MSNKLILVGMAVAAIGAIVLPTAASASPRLCETEANHTTCNNLETGKRVTGRNVGNILLTDGSGNTLISCTAATWTGTLTTNTGSHIAIDIESTTAAGTGASVGGEPECTGSFGNITVDTNIGNGTPECLTMDSTGKVTVRGGACNEAARSLTFVLTSTTVGSCRYNRTNPIEGTYTTDLSGTQDAILHITGGTGTEFTKEEGSFLCPTTARLAATYTLETDLPPNTLPLYIK